MVGASPVPPSTATSIGRSGGSITPSLVLAASIGLSVRTPKQRALSLKSSSNFASLSLSQATAPSASSLRHSFTDPWQFSSHAAARSHPQFRFGAKPELAYFKMPCMRPEVESGKWGECCRAKPDLSRLAKVGDNAFLSSDVFFQRLVGGWRLVSRHFSFLLGSAIFPALVMNEKDISEWKKLQKNISEWKKDLGRNFWMEGGFVFSQKKCNELGVIFMSNSLIIAGILLV